ncbi:MAG: hydroxyphenylacetyl-CoA thioesterase PaaI [Flavobacteriia bacterium]|nr:hydroxyphenylacetyl-CoA thioesterase PaaI [Flavobacteriia bacterium]
MEKTLFDIAFSVNFTSVQIKNMQEELRNTETPQRVMEIMMEKDEFTKWLGIEFISIESGACQLKFKVRKEMLNGFNSIHGGVLFSAADSAFAFACNSYGLLNVALECNISFTRPAFEGQELLLTAKEINKGKTTAIYEVSVVNEEEKLVALFKGVAFNTQKVHG